MLQSTMATILQKNNSDKIGHTSMQKYYKFKIFQLKLLNDQTASQEHVYSYRNGQPLFSSKIHRHTIPIKLTEALS